MTLTPQKKESGSEKIGGEEMPLSQGFPRLYRSHKCTHEIPSHMVQAVIDLLIIQILLAPLSSHLHK